VSRVMKNSDKTEPTRGRSIDSDNVFISRAGWYVLKYPGSWELEEDNETVTLYNLDRGVGALVLSSYSTPGTSNAETLLLQFVESQSIIADKKRITLTEQAETRIASYDHTSPQGYMKAWAILEGPLLVLITYNCKSGAEEREMRVVEEIIKSLRVMREDHT